MANSMSNAALAEALSTFTQTTHKVLSDIETRSRKEVTSALGIANDARAERDKAFSEINVWKEEANASKAALGQAELTIAHQTDIVAQQCETIAQLRREVSQLKDQSKNWQEHFLRVEQERCALASRIDELVSERLQWTRTTAGASSLNPFNSPQSRPYIPNSQKTSTPTAALNGPSSKRTPTNGTSSFKSTYQTPESQTAPAGATALKTPASAKPRKSTGATSKPSGSAAKPKTAAAAAAAASSGSGAPPAYSKQKPGPSSTKPSPGGTQLAPQKRGPAAAAGNHKFKSESVQSSTVIRRVQAVVHIKRESDDEFSAKEELKTPRLDSVKRQSRKPADRSRVVEHDEEDDEDEDEDGEEPYQRAAPPRKLRQGKQIHYRESDYESGVSSEDELTIGTEARRQTSRKKAEPPGSPAKKRRKMVPH